MELSAPCLGLLALQRLILFLGENSPLIFVVFIIWRILRTFTVLQVAFEGLQRSLRFLLDPRQWFPKTESVQQERKSSLQDTKTVKKGTTEDAARQTPYQRLHQLLCQVDQACQMCRRAAQEAEQLVYYQRADAGRCAKPRFLLSPGPCQESQFSTTTSVEEEQESSLWTSSVTSTHVGPLDFGTEGTAVSTETSQYGARVPARQKASKPTAQDRKTRDSSCEEELDESIEDFSSWSSSTDETSSVSSWTDSSSHSTLIFSRLKSCRSCKHHRSVLQKQKSSRGSAKQAPLEATKVEEMLLPPVPISFMKEPMIDSLDSHWVVKWLQHLLGMFWILLGTLRSFMPSAPESSLGKAPGQMVMVRRPRLLAFVDAKTRKKLELHLKKRVHLKHWQLPRRVQEALRHVKPPPLPKSEMSLVQKSGRKATRSGVPGPSSYQKLLDVVKMKVKLHLAKKCIEIQTEVFPEFVLHSWRHSTWLAKQPLPRLVSRADKPSEAHLAFLPSMLPQDAKKMELVVQRRHLSSCWDLEKRYVESLAAAAPPPSSSKPLLGRKAACEFSAAQTPFLQPWGREALEAHMRQKRLQHEWGLPTVVRRSLKAFLPSVAPWGSALPKAEIRIETPPRKLGFLPGYICSLLEFHLQRMKLQQRWGLPRRVLETYQRLFPELPHTGKREAVKPFSQQPSLGIRPPPGRPKQEKKLEVHLTKKHLEVSLQSFPAAPQIPWRSSQWSQRRPLPKLILPALKTPQTRIPCSSCGSVATGRIESALQRGHLASLWGLGLKYVEAVVEMGTIVQQDAERPRPPDGTKELVFLSAEGKTPFFQPSARDILEMHLTKKRIQHEWALPSLVQRSLRSFSGHVSKVRPSKAVKQASVLPRELPFLPQKVTNVLEFHLQRMKLQQRWGLPRRVLESCRRLVPGVLYKEETTLLGKHYSQKPGLGIKPWTGGLVKPRLDVQEMQGVGLRPAPLLCLQALRKLEVHLTKKHLEVCLETFPAVLHFSRRSAWLSTSRPLPKLILPGLKTPQTRRSCLSFDLAAMGRIEVALQRGRLVSLWSLGLKYVETLAAMCPEGLSAKFKEVRFEFSEVKSPFFTNAVKENLEMHVRKKRLQHEWGSSTLVQRSLRSLIGEAPQQPCRLQKALTQMSLLHLDLCFLSEPVRQNLELHIQRMKVQRRWGIPQKVHRYVNFFHALVLEEKPQATLGLGETQTDSASQEDANTLLPKNEGCLEDLLRSTVETHLKKKSLEINFQLTGCEMSSGPIKHAFLPKCSSVSSEIKPRTSGLYFVEQDIVEKINLNIKRKHLVHLWGLPSIYTKSLSMMFGNVMAGSPPLEMSKLRRLAVEKNIGPESPTWGAMGSITKELRRTGPCFVRTEMLDLLEMNVQSKKLQHEWGLPSMVQKSLRGFAAPSLEPERFSKGIAIATPSSRGALKVTIKITKSLFFLDLATQKLLEAHLKTQTATHRWGLPKRVQKSLKMFLPPASSSQVEGDRGQAETPRHAYNRLFQTSTKQWHKAEKVHHIIPVKRPLPKADLLLGEMSRDKISRSGRGKMTPGRGTAPMFLKLEDLEFMGLHIRHKRIQHEWGLPTLVQKSLKAFAPVPPEPQKKSLTGLARERVEDGRKASQVVHVPRPTFRVLVPHQCFLSRGAKARLEYHVSHRTRQHKWGLPQRIRDSLRAIIPPPQVPDEKTQPEHRLGFHLQEGVHASFSGRKGPPWGTSSWKEATIKPMKNIHHPRKPDARPSSRGTFERMRFLCPRTMLSFLPVEKRDLLEFHIQRKKIQHAWGLPSTVLRSLRVFAPYLLQPEWATGKTTSRKPRREIRGVQIFTQDLDFLSLEVKERLEAHLRHRTSEHRWGLPERVRRCLRAFLPRRSPPCPGITGFHPLSPLPPKPLPTTEDIYEPVMFKPEPKQKTLQKQNVDNKRRRATRRSRQTKAQTSSGTKTGLSFLPEGIWNLLEFHIQWKRIQHAWGLPSTVLQSLHAFAPQLLKAEKCAAGMMAKVPPCDGGEVQILRQDLDFLSVEEEERLEAHLRHLMSERRWGLPERVQRSLRAFLPPRPPSRSEVTGPLPLSPYPATDTYVQPSWMPEGTEDLQILPPSSPSSYVPRNYMSNVGKPERGVSFQNVKLGSGRATPRVKNKTHLPGFKAKMVSLQKEDGSERPTEERGSLEGLNSSLKPSAADRELKKSPKIRSCLSYHSPTPKETSTSSSSSDRQPKWPEKKKKKVHWANGEDDSSLLVEDNEAQDSPSSSGDIMDESEESSGDGTSRSSLQEPEAAKMKPSAAGRELKRSPKIRSCLSYHSPTPKETSTSSSSSDGQPKWPEKKKKKKKVHWVNGEDVSSLLAEDNEAQDSSWSSGDIMDESEESSGDGTSRSSLQEPEAAKMKPSAAGRELKRSPKTRSCLSCHSPAPKETSTASSSSDRQPKWPEKKKKKKKKKVHWANGEDDSSLLAEDNKAQDSPLSSGDIMDEPAESSGDGTIRSSLQEPEAANMYGRPWELRAYHAPISQRVSYFFPQHVHVPYSSYEDVVARRYRQVGRRECHAMQSSRLHWRRSTLVWREFLGHPLAGATRCQAFCQTQMVERWSSECEMFLCLQCPSSSRGTRSSTGDQEVQPPNRSRNQDFVRTDVKIQVHHESCSLTLKAESKEDERRERVTLAVAKEQSLLTLETRSQGSPEGEDRRVDDWDQGRKLEVETEDRNQGTEESLREERGSWKRANSSAVGHPPNLAEDASLPLVAPMEDPSNQVYSTVAKAVVESPDDRDVIKPGEIADSKDLVFWQKRQAPVDLTQLEAMGQGGVAQRPLPRGMRPISRSPGRPPEARKSKQTTVSWSCQETRQERLVVRKLASDPKLGQGLEAPRQGVRKTPQGQRSLERERMALLGEILEKKLNLQQGLVIWRQNLALKEMEERGRKREKREAGGGGDGGRQRGRPPQPSSASVDKQPRALSTLHRCMDLLKEKLCFWKRNPKKTAGLPPKPGERGNPTGSVGKNQAAQ